MSIQAELMRELARVDRILANLRDPLSQAILERYTHDLRSSLDATRAAAIALEKLPSIYPVKWDIAA